MGEFVVITGESGSGKSTLLNVISGLDSYEEGEMYINGEETSHYTEVDYENYRRKYIGNIFQHFNLVNSYTVFQNVELVLLLNGYKKKEVKNKVLDIIKTVGLEKYKNTKAAKLSGGQKQRVAIARALAKDTPIIVADEPTGNLDVKSAKEIMKLLHDISKNKLVVIVTHNYEQVEEYATRKISMHDGKIIEDKKLKDYEVTNADVIEYKDLTFFNKLLIGFRNVFNIKVKFVLLILVYLFLTLVVFSEYSSLRKSDFDNEGYGYNYYFEDTSSNRVILNKKDKTSFSRDELTEIGKIENIDRLVEDDLFLDTRVAVYNDFAYIGGKVANYKELDSVDLGRLPAGENEIVIAGNKDDYYIFSAEEELLNESMKLQNEQTGIALTDKITIVGIKYIENNSYDYTLYVSNKNIEELRRGTNVSYSTVTLEINDNIFTSDDYRMYFQIMPNAKVKSKEVYIPNSFDMYCKNYSCTNASMKLSVKNIYYEDLLNLKVTKVLNKDNFKTQTSLNDYDEYSSVVFISEEDYNHLFMKDTYQISVFLKDIKSADSTLSEIDKMGYNTVYMREVLADPFGQVGGIIKIIRGVVFIVATVALFFIAYFIIKIILKSRNVYFSTIRILGATKKIAKQLLNIELLIDINIAFFLFLGFVGLVTSGVVTNAYITDMVSFFQLQDYIAIYLILILMSILISTRFASKLFKNSAMSTYREEV